MPKKQTQKSLKEKLVEAAKTEIENAELMIGFYQYLADSEKDQAKQAGFKVKADQLKGNVDFNNKFIIYVETL